ncbi:hypothetical protein OJAV_G00069470 [Oryzias javanicus]|uniref:ORM1-like protein 2 n=2 Tax=Oryzias TaxID=8089 RepID=A0A437D8K4_ORYJA|nr:hypothetical protein OJAV_G00069470 [Oryzias javanicus]
MDFCFTTIVVLLGLLGTGSCAPIGAHDACGDARSSSLELNHLAKIASEEVKQGSTDQASFSSKLAFMQASDMCDPESLKHKSMPCVGKIFSTLKSYSFAVKRISGFQSCMKSVENVAKALEKLSRDMGKCVESLGGPNHQLEFPGELPRHRKMNVGVAHSEVNPNTRVMNSRGIWLTYLLLTVVLHVVLLSIPFLTVPLVWTLTNVIHNLAMYLFLHTVKGTPFETPDQGKARLLTHWEQMDNGIQFTSSRKFLTISPIVLYILTSFYTKYDPTHFFINTCSLLSVLLPKLPQFHGVRIFGINKY